ncbi:uncharacterized protein EI90DRAFT_773884 [Cantharellus anzutake]|uniref:uncharacterized protein n=1 Tax=Cantharellus anzutake TaxID=1750568 RepID=UPI00190844A6|nr:uncharacterized protein EI90DRAFT_773884 [Cantharellus anzutake]KAF8342673.1 hypothetical protein EI90DRAFT_773884 [Cantharellus anzutake]
MKRNIYHLATAVPPATRNVARRNQVVAVRTYADQQAKRLPEEKAKLVFRFGPRNVPIELWPMGFILGAGLAGGSYAIYRHLAYDKDVHLTRPGKLEEELSKHQ